MKVAFCSVASNPLYSSNGIGQEHLISLEHFFGSDDTLIDLEPIVKGDVDDRSAHDSSDRARFKTRRVEYSVAHQEKVGVR